MQHDYPLVSVIIPTFNRKDAVKEAVQSILAQDYPKIEIVIVDDGSTDETKKELSKTFGSSLRYIFQENAGESSARNRGILEAQGELICFLDSDDILLPGSISARVHCFHENKNCQVSYGLSLQEKQYEKKKETALKHKYPSGYILKSYLNKFFCDNNNYMISKEEMLKHGMYREDLTNYVDVELFIRLSHKLYFCYCGTVCDLVRDRGQRVRCNFKNIMAQGTKHLDYLFSDQDLASVLADEKAKLYADCFLEMANASLKLKHGREFRQYFKRARELEHGQQWNIKFWRRWLISWSRN